MAALALYMLLMDGEAAPQVACLANSREQAKIIFEYIVQYAKSIDAKGDIVKYYRNYISTAFNQGTCKVFSADSSKLDGLNISMAIIDEFHEQRDRKLFDVMASSQGMREQPLMAVITTAGFNLESPCHDMYTLGIEVLNGIKKDDTFFPFIFNMDDGDDWEDPANWGKCQPNLGITVTEEFMKGELLKAKNDVTAEVGIRTKVFNCWCSSRLSWLQMEQVAKKMKPVNLEDFKGDTCYIGVDLSQVSDMTALSVLIPKDNKYYFKTITFLPQASLKGNPNEELYKKFIDEGSMIVTDGNVVDYDYVTKVIVDLNETLNIDTIFYDR